MGGFNEVEVVCCDMGEGHPRNLRIGGGGARREMQGFPKLHFEKICFQDDCRTCIFPHPVGNCFVETASKRLQRLSVSQNPPCPLSAVLSTSLSSAASLALHRLESAVCSFLAALSASLSSFTSLALDRHECAAWPSFLAQTSSSSPPQHLQQIPTSCACGQVHGGLRRVETVVDHVHVCAITDLIGPFFRHSLPPFLNACFVHQPFTRGWARR